MLPRQHVMLSTCVLGPESEWSVCVCCIQQGLIMGVVVVDTSMEKMLEALSKLKHLYEVTNQYKHLYEVSVKVKLSIRMSS